MRDAEPNHRWLDPPPLLLKAALISEVSRTVRGIRVDQGVAFILGEAPNMSRPP
jgi:hypothetical protein